MLDSTLPQVWPRIRGLLSTLAPSSQRAYAQTIAEFVAFLGHEPGTVPSAAALLSATPLTAQAFAQAVRRNPGMAPRRPEIPPDAELISTLNQPIQPGPRPDLLLPTVADSTYLPPNDGTSSRLSNATIAKKLTILRRTYRLLYEVGFCDQNPFARDNIRPPPRLSGQKRPTIGIPAEHVEKLLNSPDLSTFSGLRDHAILSLLFGCALRRNELCNLLTSDVRHTPKGTPFLYLRATKNGKDAEQAIPHFAYTSLCRYIQARNTLEWSYHTDSLFNVTGQTVFNLFRTHCQNAGLPVTYTPHSARATAITRLLDKGLSYRDVQGFSRHSSVSMVELYDKRRVCIDDSPALNLDYSTLKNQTPV